MAEYVLKLYVHGQSPKSRAALANLQRICEAELAGRYELTVIDVLQHPHLAEEERILATPTLVKAAPLPVHRIIGDMSVTEKVLLGLGLGPRFAWLVRAEEGR
jgi:circadian clock protein KaiB